MNTLHLDRNSFFWALQNLCALHRKPYSPQLAEQQLSAPYQIAGFVQAAGRLGLDGAARPLRIGALHKAASYPLAAVCHADGDAVTVRIVLVLQADAHRAVIANCDNGAPRTIRRSTAPTCAFTAPDWTRNSRC